MPFGVRFSVNGRSFKWELGEIDRSNIKYAFELKGPLPNSDQTKVSKEKMFKLLAMNPKTVDFAYYALPYKFQ